MRSSALLLLAATMLAPPSGTAADELTAEEIVARHIEARGGAERWGRIETLRMSGSYSAFSFRSEFTLIRRRGDLYRLDFTLLDAPAIRARDGESPWGLHKLLWPEPTRVDGPYQPQMERESRFGPLLLDYRLKGLAVESAGPGEIDGRATLNLLVTLAGGRQETWFLDAESFLEVAIDSHVVDFTQAGEPVAQRAFFDNFREVGGLVLPHQIDLEFNHRLESMTVREVEVNPEIDPALFSAPPTAARESDLRDSAAQEAEGQETEAQDSETQDTEPDSRSTQ